MPRVWVEVVDQTGRAHKSRAMELGEEKLSELEAFFYENIARESLVVEVDGENGKTFIKNPASIVWWREE